jgi:hypothetical protein
MVMGREGPLKYHFCAEVLSADSRYGACLFGPVVVVIGIVASKVCLFGMLSHV